MSNLLLYLLAAGYGICSDAFGGLLPESEKVQKRCNNATAIRTIDAALSKRLRRQERNKKLFMQNGWK